VDRNQSLLQELHIIFEGLRFSSIML